MVERSSMWSTLLLASGAAALASPFKRWVDTDYPYVGPRITIMDTMDQTVMGNGKGYPRLWQAPAVTPELGTLPTNNINVVSLAYVEGGINVHFQTPYGIGGDPNVYYSTDPANLANVAKGWTSTYDRTPPCSMVHVTQCSQFFHNVAITGLQPGTKYYYRIPGGNGTKASDTMSFTTARDPGDPTPFTVLVLNDMGYTNAKGTHAQMLNAITQGATFAWHGGDISYADDTFYGVTPCRPFNDSIPIDSQYQPTCYNGSMSTQPGGVDNPDYYIPLPKGEAPHVGSNLGGDVSTMYEPNWDIWQQWMNPITRSIPYMTTPGNHEAACSEGDQSHINETTAILNYNLPPGSSANISDLTYSSCPYSQRNFTAYRHRFTMPGDNPVGGSGNMWYSFDHGLAHFISFTSETDYPGSPENSFLDDLAMYNSTAEAPLPNQTSVMDSGPFGQVTGNLSENESYEQWNWIKNDLASVNRTKTPWVFAMSHRPMYSSEIDPEYQPQMRAAWEKLFIHYGVDAYLSGHIHWYERMLPISHNYTIDTAAVVEDHTYVSTKDSLIHLVNGQAGDVESHSQLYGAPVLNITAFLDYTHYGFSKLTVMNASMAQWEFVHGGTGEVGDYLTIVKM